MHPWEESLPGTEHHEDLVPCSASLQLLQPGQPQPGSTLPARLDMRARTSPPQVCEPGMAAPKACSSSTEVSGPPSSCGRFSWHRALFKTSAFQTAALTLLSSRFSG